MGVKTLSLADILNANDSSQTTHYVKEWGGNVIIKTLTAGARVEYERSNLLKDENGEFVKNPVINPARFVAACLYGEDGKRLFNTEEQIKFLETKNFAVVNELFSKCIELNSAGIEAVEEEEKN
jgi:hypothetical protein